MYNELPHKLCSYVVCNARGTDWYLLANVTPFCDKHMVSFRQDFICVHKDMDGRTPPPSQSLQAYLLSPVETVPNSGFISSYDSTEELACTVCSK